MSIEHDVHQIVIGVEPWLPAAEDLARKKVQFTFEEVREEHLAAIWGFCLHHHYTPKKKDGAIILMVPP